MSTVTFENIFLNDSAELGTGFGWKSYKDEKNQPTTFNGGDVRGAQWFRNFQLRFLLKSGERSRVTFDGFKRDDVDQIKRTVQEFFGITLETKDISLKGYNWGHASVESTDVVFTIQDKHSFELPLSRVINTNIALKNEVTIEFNPPPRATDGSAPSRPPDDLVEMRFYVPGMSKKVKGSDAGSDDEGDVEMDEEGNQISAAEAMHNLIKDRSDLGTVAGESIVVFEEVLILTPRGRYSLEFFPESLRLMGKSTDYRVPFTSIHRLFLLPKLDELHIQVVIGLDPPIRQGATRYPFLVAQWPKDEEVDAELNMTDEELAKYPDLQRKYEAPTFQVISRVLKSLTGKKVIPPGNFRNTQQQPGIKANVKAVTGELYFLEKGLIFIAKQPILVDFSKTESISFSRVGGGVASAKTFDMRVVSRTDGADHVFSAISKEEVEPISTFLTSKGVRLKNEMEGLMDVDDDAFGDEDDEDEDDDDASIPSDDGKKGKSKSKKDKGAAGAAGKAKAPKGAADDDDDESEDEDFASGSSDGGSPSESDSEDGDDGASDASDPMMEDIKRKQAAKRAKMKMDSPDPSGDEGKPKKKKPKSKAEVEDDEDYA